MKTGKDNNKIWLVEWHDAHSQSGWSTDEEIDRFVKEERCICANVGFILSETKDEIIIASRKLKWKEDGKDGKWAKWGELQKIPKAWIKKRLLFTLRRKHENTRTNKG